MNSFRVIGGDPAIEFVRVADGERLEGAAVAAARDYLERSPIGTVAVVLADGAEHRVFYRGLAIVEMKPNALCVDCDDARKSDPRNRCISHPAGAL